MNFVPARVTALPTLRLLDEAYAALTTATSAEASPAASARPEVTLSADSGPVVRFEVSTPVTVSTLKEPLPPAGPPKPTARRRRLPPGRRCRRTGNPGSPSA